MSSPIEKLKAEIQKSLVFDEKAALEAANAEHDLLISQGAATRDAVSAKCGHYMGARYEHAKSAKMASQFLEAIEILEKYADEWPTRTLMFNNVPFEVPGFGSPTNQIAREFLAKLSKGSEK